MASLSTSTIGCLNALPESSFRSLLLACCASRAYVDALLSHRPFPNEHALFEASHAVWSNLSTFDKLEAFAAHPRIGGIKEESDGDKFQSWSKGEQAGVADVDEAVRIQLAQMNDEYFAKHGFVFLICATGKSASEMRDRLRERLGNETDTEVAVAAEEQLKITDIRLRKALDELVSTEK